MFNQGQNIELWSCSDPGNQCWLKMQSELHLICDLKSHCRQMGTQGSGQHRVCPYGHMLLKKNNTSADSTGKLCLLVLVFFFPPSKDCAPWKLVIRSITLASHKGHWPFAARYVWHLTRLSFYVLKVRSMPHPQRALFVPCCEMRDQLKCKVLPP